MTGPDDGRPLRVHFYVNFVHSQGTYFRFHNLAVGLTRLGHQVTVFAGDLDWRARSRTEDRDAVRYVIQPECWLARAFGHSCDPVTVARRWAARTPPCDVAHLFQPFPSAAAAWLRSDARARFYDWDDLWSGGVMRGPVSRWRNHWPRLWLRLLEHRLPRRADHVTAISQFLADLARGRGARQVTLLNSGSWPTDPPDRASARARLGLRADALYAGFMGRTTAELPWCFDALAAAADRHPALRLALCGMPPTELAGIPPSVRDRVDYLGQLPPASARDFAACVDLGLLPLDEDPFNRSRLPQKFGDHLAAGPPLLCSTVGEVGRLAPLFSWAIPAGTTRAEWVRAFGVTVDRVARGAIPRSDPRVFRDTMSWDGLCRQLVRAYRSALAAT